MPPQPWTTLSTREVYRNKWMRLREDVAQMPDGRTTIYGVCEFGQCVGVLPFVDDEHVVMVRQYRYPARENHRWEMPTGGVAPDETLEQAAQRELMEEAGYRANELRRVSSYHTSKSVCEEIAHLYIGRDLAAAESPPDDTEFFERAILPFDQVLQMVIDSEIRDGMTVIAVLHAARLKSQGGW
ncbi:MAG: NUDIX hydrolase [Chloroflexi bacterium]|nr:NUDIX hydrolase [Chloroflexota bacterium]